KNSKTVGKDSPSTKKLKPSFTIPGISVEEVEGKIIIMIGEKTDTMEYILIVFKFCSFNLSTLN
ncbi:hypothetical protein AKJ42_03710, partial [candidate division MSBL1 archaeon SCGC-AAA261C02]